MSMSTVREAIQSYLAAGNIPGLNRVYLDQPWYIDGADWNLASELGSGAVAFVHLSRDEETRISTPWVKAQEAVHYDVAIVVAYQYLIPSAATGAVSEDAWVGPLDETLQGIKDLIHADPTLGSPDVIFQAGQRPSGISIDRPLPRRVKGKVLAWTVVELGVTEIIQA